MKTQQHTPEWTVDERADANGFHTIRQADGTANGNIYEQPIATVYLKKHAQLICRAVNSHAELLEALNSTVAWLERLHEKGDFIQKIHDAIVKGRAAIAKAEGQP